MKRIFFIITAIAYCLLPIACKTKQLRVEKSETQRKEVKKSQKDSVFEQKTAGKTTVFQVDNSQVFELDLETEKDSTGQSKVLEFERIRSPAGEKIIVRGGKVKLKSVGKTYMSSAQKDTLQVNSAIVRTNIQESKTIESKSFTKQKEVKTSPFRPLSLTMFISGIIILVLVFLQWRYKFFRWFPAVIAKFKRLLKRI